MVGVRFSKNSRGDQILRSYDCMDVVNKTIIPLPLVGYEIVIGNLAPRASWAPCHLISNARSCLQLSYLFVFFFSGDFPGDGAGSRVYKIKHMSQF